MHLTKSKKERGRCNNWGPRANVIRTESECISSREQENVRERRRKEKEEKKREIETVRVRERGWILTSLLCDLRRVLVE